MTGEKNLTDNAFPEASVPGPDVQRLAAKIAPKIMVDQRIRRIIDECGFLLQGHMKSTLDKLQGAFKKGGSIESFLDQFDPDPEEEANQTPEQTLMDEAMTRLENTVKDIITENTPSCDKSARTALYEAIIPSVSNAIFHSRPLPDNSSPAQNRNN
jgi:hypothetical protein